MNKLIITLLCLVAGYSIASANVKRQGGDKVESLRIAFITQRLNLTTEEAQKFWPVYNSYRSDLEALRKNFGMGPNKPEPSADQALDFEQKKLDLKKKYKVQYENVIGKEKVNTLYNLEHEFQQKMKQARDQRQGGK